MSIDLVPYKKYILARYLSLKNTVKAKLNEAHNVYWVFLGQSPSPVHTNLISIGIGRDASFSLTHQMFMLREL